MRTKKIERLLSLMVLPSLVISAGACSNRSELSFDSLEDFKEAYESDFGECSDFEAREDSTDTQSAQCDDNTVFFLVGKAPGVERFLYEKYSFGGGISQWGGVENDSTYVYGRNWVVLEEDEVSREALVDKWDGTKIAFDDRPAMRAIFESIAAKSTSGGMAEIIPMCAAVLSSDEKSVSFDTKGNDDSTGDLIMTAYCALIGLQAPDYIFDLIGATRALDGRQTESWDSFKSSWSYHPDSGLQLVISYTG